MYPLTTQKNRLAAANLSGTNFIAAAVQTCFFDVVDAIHPTAAVLVVSAAAVPAVSGRRLNTTKKRHYLVSDSGGKFPILY